ncbi:MAG: FHA domain-containing protein [Planctomycetota bacterium]
MSQRNDPPPAANVRDLIARAKRMAQGDVAAEALGRMEKDDHQDEADSFADESGFGSSFTDSSAIESSESPSKRTMQEQDFSVDSTVELPEDQIGSSDEAQPSLADPTPSSSRATSSLSTLIHTPLFRPSRRPPMAVLRVYDDDQNGFEGVRIRQTPFVIGRQDGDLVVGHERQMSRRHARIDRVQEGETWRWYLGDLRSTNGTFVRTRQAELRDGVEVLMAGELVRFLEPASGQPVLERVAPSEEPERVKLTPGSHLIGSDTAACLPFLRESPFLDPKHLRIEQVGGRWQVIDLESTNHLWVSITKRTELTAGSLFQIGEQRFGFFLP